jgi:hypothetical protein
VIGLSHNWSAHQGFFFNNISHLSEGLGQCSGVPPNLSLRSDTIWQLLFQKKTLVHIWCMWVGYNTL